MIFAYFSPEVTLPLATALAACVGFILLVGRAPLRVAAKAFRYATTPFRRAGNRVRSIGDKLDL
jgi:hypothetical protein